MFIAIPFRPDASWRHPPVGTVAMMLANLLIHVIWGRSGPEALEPYLLDFQSIHPLQWLSSAFLHANWLHLIGNLVFLYVFGAIVEDFLGRWFVPAYLVLAFASGGLEQGISLLEHREGHALGASSAIYGLLALATLWAPRTHVSTFLFVLGIRPRIVRIRVMWLAGCYMIIQVVSVWLQGGEPSSEFLHSCGIVVGLILGILCLREHWVATHGEDLFSLGRLPATTPALPLSPANVSWEEQSTRLHTAITSGESRIALAAYDVLRREHPTRLPDMPTLEHLMRLCEERLDFHRAVAIAERAIAAGPVSDGLRLRMARITGMHLGDAQGGLAQLATMNPNDLADFERREYDHLHARFARRR